MTMRRRGAAGIARLTSLRQSLLRIAAAVVVPLTLAAGSLLWVQWTQQRDLALSGLQEQARALRYALDRELTLDIAVLNGLGASQDLDRGDLRNFHRVAARTAQVRPGSWIILVDPDGQNTLNTAVPFGTPLPNLRRSLAQPGAVEWQGRRLPLPSLEIFEGPLRTGTPAFSGLVYGRLSQRPVVATNVAVLRDGQPRHVLGMAYSPDFYLDVLRAQPAAPQSVAAVLDGRGRIVARSRDHARYIGLLAPPPFDAGTTGAPPEGIGDGHNMAGTPTYYAFSRSRVNDWVAVVGIERSVLLVPARRALWVSLAAVLSMAAIATVLVVRLSRRIAVPLQALAERAQAGTAAVDDVPPSGIAEVDSLRQAMLRAARAEAQREQSAQALAAANLQLQDADRRKDEFIATLAHELRNPLAAMANAAGLLARLPEPEPLKVRMHEVLQRQTRHAARLLDDLLDLARADHGKLALQIRDLPLDLVVQRVTDDLRPAVERKRLALSLRLRPDVQVRGDEIRLAQVVTNLLDNAIKYTPEGGAIEVSLDQEGQTAVLCVCDTGAGIPAELLPRVFDPFTQDPQTLERSRGGLGLGLAIVRHLVDLHHGCIEASSDGPGCGTRIVVRLPLASDPAAPAAPGA